MTLDLAHVQVGGVEQMLGVMMARTDEGDTDTARDLHHPVGQYERRAQGIDDPGGHHLELIPLVQLLAEDDELVAGKTGDGVAWSSEEDRVG